jgi:hypothetical protein
LRQIPIEKRSMVTVFLQKREYIVPQGFIFAARVV